ncbi:hypothetical protein TYRP_019478 [Tyrophagus putrescentiae]|nr:hypothetical protein TYRP_019478 [Tyrophagus putrescentiae]
MTSNLRGARSRKTPGECSVSQQAFAYLLTTLRYSWTQWTVVIVRIRAVHFHTHSASGNRDAHPR